MYYYKARTHPWIEVRLSRTWVYLESTSTTYGTLRFQGNSSWIQIYVCSSVAQLLRNLWENVISHKKFCEKGHNGLSVVEWLNLFELFKPEENSL